MCSPAKYVRLHCIRTAKSRAPTSEGLIYEDSHPSRQQRAAVRTTYDVGTSTEAVENGSMDVGRPPHMVRRTGEDCLPASAVQPSVPASQSVVAPVFGRHRSSSDATQSCQRALAFVARMSDDSRLGLEYRIRTMHCQQKKKCVCVTTVSNLIDSMLVRARVCTANIGLPPRARQDGRQRLSNCGASVDEVPVYDAPHARRPRFDSRPNGDPSDPTHDSWSSSGPPKDDRPRGRRLTEEQTALAEELGLDNERVLKEHDNPLLAHPPQRIASCMHGDDVVISVPLVYMEVVLDVRVLYTLQGM
ncbi:hypothetical protein L227DRAFT_604787 [Lentinus tigrinus ALCF2SS1-6]|uniref:Uncharacterized protein n=1 Tax=Lentinus tigrinus ALCF2SS1-6 TaxID=1328759 RepID=A0A5C2RRF8_9APHY|nr:hypothetical protein L227DRAFT_604787 [Lentinus tigrinus ALCF2SS1-6]